MTKKILTRRGTVRKMPPFLHWTQKPGAKAKLAKAAATRKRTIKAQP